MMHSRRAARDLTLSAALVAAWLVVVALAAGCSGTNGGDEPGSHDARPDGLTLVEVGPGDVGPAPEQVCTPGEVFCASAKERARCRPDGLSWTSIGFCTGPNRCDPATVLCRPVVCSPGGPVCDAGRVGLCNGAGTGVDTAVAPADCPAESTCVQNEGCVPWICAPGEPACAPGGALGTCNADGLGATPASSGCAASHCAFCVDGHSEILCPNPWVKAPVPAEACGADGQCVEGLGCMPSACEPGSQLCGAANAVGVCAGDGLGWSLEECPPYSLCVDEGGTPSCRYDCGDSVACQRLNACLPLPPLGGEPWVPPADPTVLDVNFEVGVDDAFESAYVNVAPIRHPQTGAFVETLTAWSPGEPEPSGGWLRVLEDGVPVAATCVPLFESTFATADVVFVVDVTGSMATVIEKVKASAQALAAFLAGAGLDVRFGVVPFTDDSPAASPQPLTADVPKVQAYLGALKAGGGGDIPEDALDALLVGFGDLDFRLGAQKVFILMTDAPSHDVGDGTSYSKTSLLGAIEALFRHAVVHTVSPAWEEHFLAGIYPNPRILSCATGGTAVELTGFLSQEIQKALFAEALARSFHCTFESSDPALPHDVAVDVRVPGLGATLEGGAEKEGVTYW